MVPITNEYIEMLLETCDCLNTTLMRHDIDIFKMTLNPELGYSNLVGCRIINDKAVEVFHATRFQTLNRTEIKIAPQDAATSTGARN